MIFTPNLLNTAISICDSITLECASDRLNLGSCARTNSAVVLVAALIALLADKVNTLVIASLAIVIITCFWFLDAFFLKTERLFRKKYEWVIQKRMHGISDHLYDLNPYNEHMWLRPEDGRINVPQIMVSKTLLPFYGIPFIVSVLVVILSRFKCCPWI